MRQHVRARRRQLRDGEFSRGDASARREGRASPLRGTASPGRLSPRGRRTLVRHSTKRRCSRVTRSKRRASSAAPESGSPARQRVAQRSSDLFPRILTKNEWPGARPVLIALDPSSWGYVQRSVDECMPVSLLDLQLAVEKCCIEVPPRQLRRRLAVLQLRKHSSTCSRAAWPAALRPLPRVVSPSGKHAATQTSPMSSGRAAEAP